MFMITVLVAAISQGLTLDILLIGVLFVAFFFMYRFGMFFFNRLRVVRRTIEEISSATTQIKVRAAFTIMLIFVALSETTGTEVILGAFLAGAIVSLLRRQEDEHLEHELNVIGYGFFIPIFFIMVGVDFNLAALTGSSQALILVPELLVAAVAVKFLPVLIFKTTYSWRQTFGAGAILSARLSLIIAASAIGLRLGIISEAVNSSIVLVSLVTVSLAPIVFSAIIPSADDDREKLILVAGASELGIRVAEHIQLHHDQVLLIAKNEDQQERAGLRGLSSVIARIDQDDPQLSPFLERTRSVVCVYNDTEFSYQVCKLARQVYGIDHVVARVDDPQDMARFEDLGVITMNIAIDRAAILALMARNPGIYNLLTRTTDDKDIDEITISNPGAYGKRIREVPLPEEVLILAMYRDGEFVIPNGDTELSRGDRLSLLGSYSCLERAREIFE